MPCGSRGMKPVRLSTLLEIPIIVAFLRGSARTPTIKTLRGTCAVKTALCNSKGGFLLQGHRFPLQGHRVPLQALRSPDRGPSQSLILRSYFPSSNSTGPLVLLRLLVLAGANIDRHVHLKLHKSTYMHMVYSCVRSYLVALLNGCL